MKNKILLIISILNTLIFLPLIGSMKDVPVPLHFGINGKPDSFGNKWLLIIFPVMAVIFSLCTYIYRKKLGDTPNLKAENGFFSAFTMLTIGLGYAAYFESIGGGNMSGRIVSYYIIFGLGLLLIYMGALMKNLKQNRFFGIKTKYTLSSKEIWNRTHALGSKTGIAGGILLIVSGIIAFALDMLIIAFIGLILAIILSAFVPMIYSKKIS